jgi:hypothetical protein
MSIAAVPQSVLTAVGMAFVSTSMAAASFLLQRAPTTPVRSDPAFRLHRHPQPPAATCWACQTTMTRCPLVHIVMLYFVSGRVVGQLKLLW